ncbi:7691_t:CDS:10 [Ambispora leptoticha]|uniref:DNA-directed DNA polymerase n=1 Tax=Ambispora leptoticha TaxID=144679 RepID=A0A9N8WM27_9GLOM|nr:7691_t:CDS:10 [Ambispora leptoticha]
MPPANNNNMSEISEEFMEITLERVNASYYDMPMQRNELLLKEKTYRQQYANLYFLRLTILGPIVLEAAQKKWDTTEMDQQGVENVQIKTRHTKKVLETKPGVVCYILGTLYVSMPYKPNILDEVTKEHWAEELPPREKYCSENDEYMLEDESGRIKLIGDILKTENLVTGIVLAVLGFENKAGEFEVMDICYAGIPPQKKSNQMETDDNDEQDTDKYVALVSGLNIGSDDGQNSMERELFIDYITGMVGSTQEQITSSKIVHVILAGNNVVETKLTEDDSKYKKHGHEGTDYDMGTVAEFDNILETLCSTVSVDVMPGSHDPANATLPQQPIHFNLFPKASRYSSFSSVTNPYWCQIDDVMFLGNSGQTIDDIYKNLHGDNRLEFAEKTLYWRHIAPTAPDTLWCYPFISHDPFILTQTPHIYYFGNQKEFATSTVDGPDGQYTRIILIPSFAETGVVVPVLQLSDSPRSAAAVVSTPLLMTSTDLSEEQERFYNAVREIIIMLLLFLPLYSVSYNVIQRFRRKQRQNQAQQEVEDEEEDVFGIDELIMGFLCAAGLAMALAGFFLLPGTMAATALIELQSSEKGDDNNKQHYYYYLGWLDTNLLVTLWNYTFIGCNISLFGLLPFAYFYNETDQLRNFFAKARESLTLMLLVGLLIYGFIYVSKAILKMNELPSLVVLNLLTCLMGGAICLTATPKGYVKIFSWIYSLPLRPNYRKSLKDKLVENKMETRAWEHKLESLERELHSNNIDLSYTFMPSVTSSLPLSSKKLYVNGIRRNKKTSPTESLLKIRDEIQAKLKKLELERKQTQLDLSHSPLYRNISFFLLFVLSHIILFLLISYVAFNFMKGILVFDEKANNQQPNLLSVFGKKTSSFLSMFGAIGTLTEIALIFYFTFATIIGVYSMPLFAQMKPQWGRMTMQKTIGNVALLLVISSSLPAIVRILGLLRFESAGPYENFHLLKNGNWVNTGFRLGVLITSVLAFLDYYILGSLRSFSGGRDWNYLNNNYNGHLAFRHYHNYHQHPHYHIHDLTTHNNGFMQQQDQNYNYNHNNELDDRLVIGSVANDGYRNEYTNGYENEYTNGYTNNVEDGNETNGKNGYANGYDLKNSHHNNMNGYIDDHRR